MNEFAINLNLNQQTVIEVPCDCGEWHSNVVAMTADEKRAANRERVAWQSHVAAYLASDGSTDAWKYRTLNLDGMISAGRI